MKNRRFKRTGARAFSVFAVSCILALVGLVSCDIGNWDITQSAASRGNINALEEIDFISGYNHTTGEQGRTAFPLIFGTSSHNRGSAILGSGQRSMRFQNEVFQGQRSRMAEIPFELPAASPHRMNPDFPTDGLIPDYVPPGFIEIAATRSGQGGGKIAGSEDGIAFLFREVPLDRNFRMEADFLIISYGLVNAGAPHTPGSNGQEGFGIMVRDFVPQIAGTPGDGVIPGRPGGGAFVPGTTMESWEENHGWRFQSAAGRSFAGGSYAPHSPDGRYLLRGMVHEGAFFAGNEIPEAQGLDNRDRGSDPRNTSFHYFVGAAGFGADSNIMMAGGTKRGMRIKWRAGIERSPALETMGGGNPTSTGTQLSTRFRFDYQPRGLGDYSFFTEMVDGVEMATMAARPDFPRWGSTVRVMLERTNDGFRYRIENLDDRFDLHDLETGRLIARDQPKPMVTSEQPGMGIIPDRDILGMVNSTHFYVGLFASRDAVVWAHNIRYWEADRARTAPATPIRPTPFEPEFEVVSPPYYGGVNYLFVRANTAGSISVTQNGRRIPPGLITNEWIVETQNGAAIPLSLFTVPIFEPTEGDNIFSVTFYPGNIPRELEAQGFIHSSSTPIRTNFNMMRRTFHEGTGNIYVGPDGRRDGAGTRGSPLDLQTAINHVMPGQHIVMLNGRYVMDAVVTIPRFNDGRETLDDGRSGRKVLRAENVNRVWLDWDKNEAIGPEGTGIIGGEAFMLSGSWWHLDGFHIRGAPNRTKGIVVSGHNNLITRLMTYNNGDTGFQISGRSAEPVRFWPSGNVVKWTESFHNFDIAQTNADGFGAKLTVGERNRFYSSIAHHNNDDGWDLFSKRDTGAIGVVLVDYSIAYRQGNMLNNFQTAAGHNGFKMGGEGIGIFHEIRQSLAFANGNTTNRGWQITSNSNPNQIVRDSTTANHIGRSAGNIEVRGGGGGVATGNTHTSVATVSSRQGGTAAPFATTGAARPGINDKEFSWTAEQTDWEGIMETRSAGFWGYGDTGITHPTFHANGPNGTGDTSQIVNGVAIQKMPGCYSDWTQFRLFIPRDELFAYPLLGDLYRPPAGFGAHGLYDRCPAASRAFVLSVIPWAADDTNPAR